MIMSCSTVTTKINHMFSFAHFLDHRREGGSGEASKGGALQHGSRGRGGPKFIFKKTAISNAPLTLLCTLANGKQNDGK